MLWKVVENTLRFPAVLRGSVDAVCRGTRTTRGPSSGPLQITRWLNLLSHGLRTTASLALEPMPEF
jgi:hypothetical protein